MKPAVVLLAILLALGFLLVILSCALWSNWLPLLSGEESILPLDCLRLYEWSMILIIVLYIHLIILFQLSTHSSPSSNRHLFTAFTFVLAPLPNALCARCAGADLVSDDYNS